MSNFKIKGGNMKNKVLLVIVLMLSLVSCTSRNKNQVVVFNAGEYMDMDLVKEFEKDTGIEVVYETFTSDEEMFIKLSQSSNNYDVIVPSDYMVERLLKNNMLEKIDQANIPNFKYIDDRSILKIYLDNMRVRINNKAIDTVFTFPRSDMPINIQTIINPPVKIAQNV